MGDLLSQHVLQPKSVSQTLSVVGAAIIVIIIIIILIITIMYILSMCQVPAVRPECDGGGSRQRVPGGSGHQHPLPLQERHGQAGEDIRQSGHPGTPLAADCRPAICPPQWGTAD